MINPTRQGCISDQTREKPESRSSKQNSSGSVRAKRKTRIYSSSMAKSIQRGFGIKIDDRDRCSRELYSYMHKVGVGGLLCFFNRTAANNWRSAPHVFSTATTGEIRFAIKVIDSSLRGTSKIHTTIVWRPFSDFSAQGFWFQTHPLGLQRTSWCSLSVCDAKARRLTNEQRSAVAEYFRVYKGNENNARKVTLMGHSLHPFLARSYVDFLKDFFEGEIQATQSIISTKRKV